MTEVVQALVEIRDALRAMLVIGSMLTAAVVLSWICGRDK